MVVLALGGAAGAVLYTHFSSSGHPLASPAKLAGGASAPPAADNSSSPADNSSPATDQSSAAAEQAAAQALSGLLTQSTSDRSSIQSAVADAGQCGDLTQDQQVFQNAVSSRQQLLTELATLTDGSALPGPMTQALAGAWQASIQADQDFAAWTQDEISNGCGDSSSDSNYQAAMGPDDQASADKRAFVNLWNPIAGQYALQTYQENQL